MQTFVVVMSLRFAVMAQHVSNVNDPGLQQFAHGLSATRRAHEEFARAAPSNNSQGSVQEPGLEQAASGIAVAERGASSSIAKTSMRNSRRVAGNASASDFHDLMVAKFEVLWSGSWGGMVEVVHHSALVRDASSSSAGGAARKLRLAPQLSSRNGTSDNNRVIGGNGKAKAPSVSYSIRGSTGGVTGLTDDTAVVPGMRMISVTKTEVENTTKSGSKSEGASGTITDAAVAVAKEQSTRSAIHVSLERSAKNVQDPTLQVVDTNDFKFERTANLRTTAKHDDIQDETKDDVDANVVNGSVALSRGVARSRVKRLVVRSHVVDGVEASGGGLTHSVVEQSPKKASRISTGQADIAVRTPNHEAAEVRQASVARFDVRPGSPEKTSEVKPVVSGHDANATVGRPARLVKRRAGTQHMGSKANLHSEPAARALAHASDVPVAEDFLNTVDSGTLNGPTAKLLAAERDFNARSSRIAKRITQDRGRVANIRSNVGALAAALASTDNPQ